jgi:hypothetical protein
MSHLSPTKHTLPRIENGKVPVSACAAESIDLTFQVLQALLSGTALLDVGPVHKVCVTDY